MNTLEIFGVILFCSASMCIRYIREWVRHAKPRRELAPRLAIHSFGVIVSIVAVIACVTNPSLNQPAPPILSWIYLILTVLLASALLVSFVRWGSKAGKVMW